MAVNVAVAVYPPSGTSGVGFGGILILKATVEVEPDDVLGSEVFIIVFAVVLGLSQQVFAVLFEPVLHAAPLSLNEVVKSAEVEAITVYPNCENSSFENVRSGTPTAVGL